MGVSAVPRYMKAHLDAWSRVISAPAGSLEMGKLTKTRLVN